MELCWGWLIPNLMLDTRTYEIEFPDGHTNEYTANLIAHNMYAQFFEEGNQHNLMDIIVDHRADGHAVACADMYIKHGSNRKVRKTTIGWSLCVVDLTCITMNSSHNWARTSLLLVLYAKILPYLVTIHISPPP
jgi:hypothetical protein